jgi:hypothetical protein
VNLLVGAGICLVLAQLLGIYALITRKADVILALVMGALLSGALLMAAADIYDNVH